MEALEKELPPITEGSQEIRKLKGDTSFGSIP